MATLQRLGGPREIVRAHLVVALETLSEHDQNLAAELFNHLVTPSGTKIAHGLHDLAEYAAVSEGEVAPVLSALVDERIVRPVTVPGIPEGSQYEIFHDVLAEPVVAWRARHEAERTLERTRREAKRRHRRLLVVTVVALIAAGAMVLVTLFALAQRHDARREAADARAAARVALAGELTSKASVELTNAPERSLALAVRSARLEPRPGVEGVLRAALLRAPLAVLHVGAGPVNNVDLSRSHLAIAGSDGGTALVFDWSTQRPIRTLRFGSPVEVARLSREGKIAVTAGGRRFPTVIWNPRTGERIHSLRQDTTVVDVALTLDGTRLATGGGNGQVIVWDVRSGKRLQAFTIGSAAKDVRFSKDGTMIAAVGANGHAFLYGTEAGGLRPLGSGMSFNPRTQEYKPVRQGNITAVSFSPGGRLLATAGADGSVFVWNLEKGGALQKKFQGSGHLLDVVFSPAGSLLATASFEGTGMVWNAGAGRVAVLAGHTNAVTRASFSGDGTLIATSSEDWTSRVWKAKGGRQLLVLAGHHGPSTTPSSAPMAGSSRPPARTGPCASGMHSHSPISSR